jgi:hypothetical protein
VWTSLSSSDLSPLQYRQLREQCCDCGKLLSQSLSHSLATSDTPDVDEDRARAALDNEKEERERAWREVQREQAEANKEWWRQYNDYLRSSEWFCRHDLVLQRANGICEGCRRRPATQVHHLTYNHVRNEFLWELVAICDVCHERFHENSKSDIE